MVNPITSNVTRLRPALDVETHRASQPATGTKPSGVGAGPRDSLSLSASAGVLPEALTQGPPVDRALVDRLATAISEGAYPIDPDRIADVLFRDGQDFSR